MSVLQVKSALRFPRRSLEQLDIGHSCKRMRSTSGSRPGSRSKNKRTPNQGSECRPQPLPAGLQRAREEAFLKVTDASVSFFVEGGVAGTADKTAQPPLLPPPPPPHRPPLRSALLGLRRASRLVRARLPPACLTLSTSSKCLTWTLCAPFPLRHLRNTIGNGNRSEERIQPRPPPPPPLSAVCLLQLLFICFPLSGRWWIYCGATRKPMKAAVRTHSGEEAATSARTSPADCCCSTDSSCSSGPTSANRRDTSCVTGDRWVGGPSDSSL